MLVWWGPNYIQFYNDAYKETFGREKPINSLGERGEESWSELWPVMSAQIEAVFKHGEAIQHTNQRFEYIQNGETKEAYCTYGYSPIFLHDGSIGGVLAITNETTDQIAIQRVIENDRDNLHSLLSQTSIAVCVLEGPDHRFTLANSAYDAFVGREVLGKNVRDVFTDEEAGKFVEVLDVVSVTGQPYSASEIELKLKGKGEGIFVNISYHPVRHPNGTIRGIAVIIQNVTEQVRARRTIQSVKESAEAANEAKSFFLANMSHEIRTPLGAIIGFTELLKSPALAPDERDKYLGIISRNCQALSSIIDDVLDLSKIEAGKIEIEQESFFFSDCVSEVCELFSEKASAKGLEIKFERSQFPAFNIISDPLRLRQILINLVGNAVKFTSQGSIVIHGTYEMLNEENLKMNVSITDTGKGLTADDAEKLFKPFAQADGKSARQYGGTGLGLALSRKIARALGGDVALARTEQARGCTFSVEFIATRDPRGRIEDRAPSESLTPRLDGLKVLVVDDSPDNRQLIKLLLAREGAIVDQASSGEQALNLIRSKDFDTVLMDIQMPGLDGYETLGRMRQEHYKKPVFALTAYAMKEDRNRALQCGFSGHIPKPINSNNLVEVLLANTRRLH